MLRLTWQGDTGGSNYFVAARGSDLFMELDHDTAVEVAERVKKGEKLCFHVSTGRQTFSPIPIRPDGAGEVRRGAWPVSLESTAWISVRVAPFGEPTPTKSPDDAPNRRVLFVLASRAAVAKTVVLGALVGLTFVFAPLIASSTGAVRSNALLASATPVATALIALVHSNLFHTSDPPLFGILHRPARALVASAALIVLALVGVNLFVTAVTNATPSDLRFNDAGTLVEIKPGETRVLAGRAVRNASFWPEALGVFHEAKHYCSANVAGPPTCTPFPEDSYGDLGISVAPRVIVHCAAQEWPGWSTKKEATFEGAVRGPHDKVFVQPGAGCVPATALARVKLVAKNGNGTDAWSAKYPWQPPADEKSSVSPAEHTLIEEKPGGALQAFSLTRTEADFCLPNAVSGFMRVKRGGDAGQDIGSLFCAASLRRAVRITLSTAGLKELAIEDSASGLLASVWTPALGSLTTQAEAWLCTSGCGLGSSDAKSLTARAVFATDQEPESFRFEIPMSLRIDRLSVAVDGGGRPWSVGHASCANARGKSWSRVSVKTEGSQRLLSPARIDLVPASGQHVSLSMWARSPNQPAEASTRFPSPFLCTEAEATVSALIDEKRPASFDAERRVITVSRPQAKVCRVKKGSTQSCPNNSGNSCDKADIPIVGCDIVEECQC